MYRFYTFYLRTYNPLYRPAVSYRSGEHRAPHTWVQTFLSFRPRTKLRVSSWFVKFVKNEIFDLFVGEWFLLGQPQLHFEVVPAAICCVKSCRKQHLQCACLKALFSIRFRDIFICCFVRSSGFVNALLFFSVLQLDSQIAPTAQSRGNGSSWSILTDFALSSPLQLPLDDTRGSSIEQCRHQAGADPETRKNSLFLPKKGSVFMISPSLHPYPVRALGGPLSVAGVTLHRV